MSNFWYSPSKGEPLVVVLDVVGKSATPPRHGVDGGRRGWTPPRPRPAAAAEPIRGGVNPAAPILSRGRHRHGPSAVRPAFGGRPKSFPPENFSVIPPAGAHRSSLRRPPCDGGRPLGRNARRAPGTSRRFLYTSHAGAPPAVVLQCSLLPLSAFQARTGVFRSVTGHRPLPGEMISSGTGSSCFCTEPQAAVHRIPLAFTLR